MKQLKLVGLFSIVFMFFQCEKEAITDKNEQVNSVQQIDDDLFSKTDLIPEPSVELNEHFNLGAKIGPANKNVPYNKISFKGSHNSYERRESIAQQLTHYKKNGKTSYNGNCMGLEFDIWRHTKPIKNGRVDAGLWTVNHLTNTGPKFSRYLSELLDWHNITPNHHPVMVKLDVKSKNGGYQNFHDQIDVYLKNYFNESLVYKPREMFVNNRVSLVENISAYGWPSVNKLRGKFIFVLTGNSGWGTRYSKTNLRSQRLCFTMKEMPADRTDVFPPTKGNIAIFNFHIFSKNTNKWKQVIPRFAAKKMLTRVYIANSSKNFSNSIMAKVNCISTDKINNHKWAVVNENGKFLSR
ncbi:Ca2+-dependent phosphoinositide-specific phospholipase C [Aquimarina agarivorans]|uniref:Ca2+-dependent phosphoinositide-specific phospholipase C n=1 Tax=Aquimarina agarivorans TaxID=980584 RepID=UPI000248EA3B|nr:Ca2+-dependent phosphoinositide-specific phospholipase C [Aquimarina agarivorans]